MADRDQGAGGLGGGPQRGDDRRGDQGHLADLAVAEAHEQRSRGSVGVGGEVAVEPGAIREDDAAARRHALAAEAAGDRRAVEMLQRYGAQ